MSLRNKLLEAARVAVIEERARILWCADQAIQGLEEAINHKLLSSAQLHASKVKFQIAKAVVAELRRAIISGVGPVSNGQVPGSAGFSSAASVEPLPSPPAPAATEGRGEVSP